MAKKAQPAESPAKPAASARDDVLREPAEVRYADQLEALRQNDPEPAPPPWRLSPRSVLSYVVGGKALRAKIDGRDTEVPITRKFFGDDSVVERAIVTLASERALLLVGEPGTGKCVKGDTVLVDTRTGERIRIADAVGKRDLCVSTLHGDYKLRPQAPTDYLYQGVRPCYRLTTHLGREIEVTLNHPFLTMGGWKQLSELTIGDHVALPRSLPVFGSAELSDSHVILLAHLIAEGCLTQNLPYFSNTCPEMQCDFSAAVTAAFPELVAHWSPDGRFCSISGGRRGPHFKNPSTRWLQELGLMGLDSGEKFVPSIVFMLPRRQIALFLNRLFSGDGHLQHRKQTGQVAIEYCSKSKRLIHDVQHLLLRFGINARIFQTRAGHHRLFIQGRAQCQLYLDEIGFLRRDRANAAAASFATTNRVENPNLDLIPNEVWPRLDQAAIAAGYSGATTLVKADRGDTYKGGGPRWTQGLSRARLLRLAQRANDQGLAQLAQSDIYWDRIRSIEFVGEHSVYDLSIAETHNFVANDIIIHNSWLSEHLAAAVCGNSTLTIQGTAGTTEEHVKYSWNIARVIAEGPKPDNLIPSPTMVAMRAGAILRFEEITRCVPDVQDALVSLLSDKAIAVPELPDANMVWARPGFNVIATANTRDQGVNELSAALKRRFNYVHIPIVADRKMEIAIVQQRSAELLRRHDLPAKLPPPVIELLATIFRELRDGKTADGVSIKKPATACSTAEAIGVAIDAALHARFFGSGAVGPADVARNLVGAVVKEDLADLAVLKEYVVLVARKRATQDGGWKAFHDTALEVMR